MAGKTINHFIDKLNAINVAVDRVCELLKKNKYLLLIASLLFFIVHTDVCYSATYYMGTSGRDSYSASKAQNRSTPWLTLNKSLNSMSANDTLIILGGTYTGSNNVMAAYGAHPPNGTGVRTDPNEGYTVVKAEVDGTVTFDGQNARMMFKFNGDGPFSHLKFQGLKWVNSTSHGIQAYNFNHAKFIRCGAQTNATGNVQSFSITNSSYVLAEECYAWGGGRYKFIAYLSDHIVFRRCIGRLDAVETTMPIATFQSYCSQYVEWQNCIAIDNDAKAFWRNYSYLEGGFTNHETHRNEPTTYNYYRGCIVLKHDSRGFTQNDHGLDNLHYENIIVWDTADSAWAGNVGSNLTVNHFTVGNSQSRIGLDNSWGGNSNNFDVRNSIIYGFDVGLAGVRSSNYNSLYNNTTDYSGVSNGANDFSSKNSNDIDPVSGVRGDDAPLKYLVRIEDGSILDGAASDGGDIGATVMTKIGASGTLYGETGYNVDTGTALWPFPYEDQIRADMRTYNPGGSNRNQPDGTRGFCAENQTLTKYIWGYLGNGVPAGLYTTSKPGKGSWK